MCSDAPLTVLQSSFGRFGRRVRASVRETGLHRDPVAEFEKGRARFAAIEHFDHPLLGEAARSGVPSAFETVPEPTIVPALSRRVRAQWATRSGKENAISAPEADPTRSPFSATCRFMQTRPSRHAAPSSSGVTAIGAKLVEGFACRKPKPFGISRAERAQTPVVDLDDQADAVGRARRRRHPDLVDDDPELALEVDAVRPR